MHYIYAKAEEDSANGRVKAYVGNTLATLLTTIACKKGDRLHIQVNEGKVLVVGVVGRGDEQQVEINENKLVGITNNSNIEFVALMTDVDI